MTAPDISTGRPAWVADIAAILGEPRVKVETPARSVRDEGTCWRRCWVWFPGLSNHNISIDQYGKCFVVNIACHCNHKDITVRSVAEPSDEEMRLLMASVGWPEVVAS